MVFKQIYHDVYLYLKTYVKKIELPIILHLSALSTLYFNQPFLPTFLFLSFFILACLSCLLFILLFILILVLF